AQADEGVAVLVADLEERARRVLGVEVDPDHGVAGLLPDPGGGHIVRTLFLGCRLPDEAPLGLGGRGGVLHFAGRFAAPALRFAPPSRCAGGPNTHGSSTPRHSARPWRRSRAAASRRPGSPSSSRRARRPERGRWDRAPRPGAAPGRNGVSENCRKLASWS